MSSAIRSWWLMCLCLALVGCGEPEYEGAARYPLSGKVTYNGESIDLGSITFLPAISDSADSKQRVSGGEIINGEYSVPEGRGANAGKYRVEIHWQKRTGRLIKEPQSGEMIDERVEGIPAKFHRDSELTVEISPGQTDLDFHLESK